MGRGFVQIFLQKKICKSKLYTLKDIKGMQIKTTMRYHFMPSRMALILKDGQ